MEADSCPSAELSPDYCECCAKEGKKDIKKFQWKLSQPRVRTGYFCSRGHFWEESKHDREEEEEEEEDKGEESAIDYGEDREDRVAA